MLSGATSILLPLNCHGTAPCQRLNAYRLRSLLPLNCHATAPCQPPDPANAPQFACLPPLADSPHGQTMAGCWVFAKSPLVPATTSAAHSDGKQGLGFRARLAHPRTLQQRPGLEDVQHPQLPASPHLRRRGCGGHRHRRRHRPPPPASPSGSRPPSSPSRHTSSLQLPGPPWTSRSLLKMLSGSSALPPWLPPPPPWHPLPPLPHVPLASPAECCAGARQP